MATGVFNIFQSFNGVVSMESLRELLVVSLLYSSITRPACQREGLQEAARAEHKQGDLAQAFSHLATPALLISVTLGL